MYSLPLRSLTSSRISDLLISLYIYTIHQWNNRGFLYLSRMRVHTFKSDGIKAETFQYDQLQERFDF
jgi:hypothetical protein